MKIAVSTKNNWSVISGHAGKTRDWLIFEPSSDGKAWQRARLQLERHQLPHYCEQAAGHPLYGVDVILTASAGDGYIRRMQQWGSRVVVTGEVDPQLAVAKLHAGETLAAPRFDITTTLCKLRDFFSPH